MPQLTHQGIFPKRDLESSCPNKYAGSKNLIEDDLKFIEIKGLTHPLGCVVNLTVAKGRPDHEINPLFRSGERLINGIREHAEIF